MCRRMCVRVAGRCIRRSPRTSLSPLASTSMAAVDALIANQLESIDKEDAQLISIIDNIVGRLVDQRLAWTMKIPPKFVGVHPANRGGYGVSAVEVHALGRDIVKMGWSTAATAHAVCIEDGPDKSIAKFSVRSSHSTPGLGVVDESTIKYGSLACSHTNQFLVAVLSQIESEHEVLTIAGRMSPAKLGARDPKLAQALEHGLSWLVLSAQVADLYPRLPDLLQHARNATGAVQRLESEFATLSRIQSMVALRGSGSVDWSRIGEAVGARSKLSKSEIASLLRFVQLFGGGDEGRFIRDLDHFSKVFVPTGRVVPIATFAALTELKLAPADIPPFFISAVVKAQAACPPSKIANGICRYISATDIASLAGPRRQLMSEAEVVLRACRILVADRRVNEDALSKAFARLDTLMARMVFGKDTKFQSPTELGVMFVEEIRAALAMTGDASNIASPFASPAGADDKPSAAGSSEDTTIVQYEADGSTRAAHRLILRSAGFVDGSLVKDALSQVFKILSIDDAGQVTLQRIDAQGQPGESLVVEFAKFGSDYQKTSHTFGVVADWMERRWSTSLPAKEQAAKSMVALALARLSEEPPAKLRIQLKPTRAVFSVATVAIGKLVLVPETTKIITAMVVPLGGLGVATPIDLGGKQVVLMPLVNQETIVPAWMIRIVDDPEVATMHLVHRAVSIATLLRRKSSEPIDLSMPVLVNRCAMKVGDELTLYREPLLKKAAKRQVPSELASALKLPKFE